MWHDRLCCPPNQSRLHISMEAQGSNVSRWWQLKLCVYVTGLCYCNLQFYLAKETSFLCCFSMFTQLYTAKRQKKALTSWQITLCSTSQTWQNHCGAPALPPKISVMLLFLFSLGCGDFCWIAGNLWLWPTVPITITVTIGSCVHTSYTMGHNWADSCFNWNWHYSSSF